MKAIGFALFLLFVIGAVQPRESTAQSAGWERLTTPLAEIVDVSSSNGSVLAETRNEGLFRSTDQGSSWVRIRTLGTGESAGFVSTRSGIVLLVRNNRALTSTDGGDTWRADVPLFEGVADTVNSVYASMHGLFIGLTDEEILHSPDSGQSWNRIDVVDTDCPITGFADRRDNEVLLGSECHVLELRMSNGAVESMNGAGGYYHVDAIASPLGSFLMATDGGIYWASRPAGFIVNVVPHVRSVTEFAVSAAGQTVFAATRTDGILRSENRGMSWEEFNLNQGPDTNYVGVVFTDDRVLTFTASSVYRLSDTSSVSSVATDATTETGSTPGDIRRLSID